MSKDIFVPGKIIEYNTRAFKIQKGGSLGRENINKKIIFFKVVGRKRS